MRRLVLMRHAKAVRPEEVDDDFDRGLAPRGRDDALEAGRRLAALKLGAEGLDALVSAAARTQQTWRLLADALPPARVEHLEELYLAEPDRLAEAVDRTLGRSRADVLVIGHNPGLKMYAGDLCAGVDGHDPAARSRLAEGLPTAWFLVLELTPEVPRRARLAMMDGPPRPGGD